MDSKISINSFEMENGCVTRIFIGQLLFFGNLLMTFRQLLCKICVFEFINIAGLFAGSVYVKHS